MIISTVSFAETVLFRNLESNLDLTPALNRAIIIVYSSESRTVHGWLEER